MKRITLIGLTLLGLLPLSAAAAEQNFAALGDPRLEAIGNSIQATKDCMGRIANQAEQGFLNFANRYPGAGMVILAVGSVVAPCVVSYLWGKIAKPKPTSSNLHKGIYTTVACAIPFVLPTIALAAQRAERWAPGKITAMLATLTAYPMGMVGSYIGHNNA
jgi:hypothetical protein